MKNIIYPKYAMWIFIYTVLFSFSSILYGKFLDVIAEKYDRLFLNENEQKSKLRLIIEVCLQLGTTSIGVYIFRELLRVYLQKYFKVEHAPDEFAALVVAPIIFAQQPTLMNKITSIYDNIFEF